MEKDFHKNRLPMKYILNHTAYLEANTAKYNASSKARTDVTTILENVGYMPHNIYVRNYKMPKMSGAVFLLRYCAFFLKLRRGDELCIQYPIKRNMLYYFFVLLKLLKKRGVRIVFVVHDLDYLRIDSYMDIKTKILKPLYLADKIIAHTPSMKEHLESEGIKTKIDVLYLFDYLTKDPITPTEYCISHKNEIVFAGNLQKSKFLRQLNNYTFDYVKFAFYGLKPDYSFSEGKDYKGVFKPENTSFIKGGWGLVWDGDSLDTCTGLIGEYLKYNASHKLSLYITAGIPVIVWSSSGLAKWITENKLGLCINSLKELDSVLSSISEEEYLVILHNVQAQCKILRSGRMILNALTNC